MDYLKIIGILIGMVVAVVVLRKILFPERPGVVDGSEYAIGQIGLIGPIGR
jgi:hypothetical protein